MSKAKTTQDRGYGKPPQEHQFKPGQSGNPKGRPKGSKNFGKQIIDMMEQKIPVTMNGETKRLQANVAIIQAQLVKAMKGDRKAAEMCLDLYDREVSKSETLQSGRDARGLSMADRLRLEELRERLSSSPDPSTKSKEGHADKAKATKKKSPRKTRRSKTDGGE